MKWMIMPLRRYADFSGRSQRMEYWMFVLFLILVLIGGVLAAAAIAQIESVSPALGSGLGIGLVLALAVFFLGILIPLFAVQVRRFHDQDLSGWLVLVGFIPSIGGLIMLIFMCVDGTPGTNRYGPDPKGRGDHDARIFA